MGQDRGRAWRFGLCCFLSKSYSIQLRCIIVSTVRVYDLQGRSADLVNLLCRVMHRDGVSLSATGIVVYFGTSPDVGITSGTSTRSPETVPRIT